MNVSGRFGLKQRQTVKSMVQRSVRISTKENLGSSIRRDLLASVVADGWSKQAIELLLVYGMS
jgi:hypothetical protein